jgi:hypothetical protein
MKELLQASEVVVGKSPPLPPRPNTEEVITADFHYDAAQVVRSVGYGSRFFRFGYTRHTHLLWGYDVGTRIVNRFSAEEKKMVANFATVGDSAKNAESRGIPLDGTYSCEEFSLTFEHGKCYCVDTASKERAETEYLVKDGKVYIAPVVPRGKQMTRKAWPVYTIKGDSLEFTPKIVLVRAQDGKDK